MIHFGMPRSACPILLAGVVLSALVYPQSPAIARLADGKPDMNGVWQRPYVPDMSRTANDQQGPGELPFTPWGAETFKNYDVSKFDYTGHCLPQGLTRSMNSPFPIQIVQTPKTFAVLYEAWNVFHIVPVDGRNFPKELEPTWMGTSIGRWDGDTMVVEQGLQRKDQPGYRRAPPLRRSEGNRAVSDGRPQAPHLRSDDRRSEDLL